MPRFSDETLHARRERLAAALDAEGPAIVIGAGVPLSKPGGLDQCFPYRPHPEYYWLTGLTRPGGAVGYVPGEGWTSFVVPVSDAERLWTADECSPVGTDISKLAQWCEAHRGRGIVILGCPISEIAAISDPPGDMQFRIDAVRRRKDSEEIAILQAAIDATASGFAAAQHCIRPGVTERSIQIELEAAMFRSGAEGVGYESIVGIGPHAAILHCQPGNQIAGADDMVLIDAGGEIGFYTADVTRTYATSGKFTPEQQAIYDIVLAAELASIDRCRLGVEWHDVHRTAAGEIAAGLKHLGILTCGIDEALDTAAVWLFFPHGIGHTLGLGVRDVGGHAPNRNPGRKCCGATPRIDLPLEPDFVVTVEPGIYFVPAILDDAKSYRQQFRDAVDWDKLQPWRAVGGVRIEDNVLITQGVPVVLTAGIPK